jgi:hypothetical protein
MENSENGKGTLALALTFVPLPLPLQRNDQPNGFPFPPPISKAPLPSQIQSHRIHWGKGKKSEKKEEMEGRNAATKYNNKMAVLKAEPARDESTDGRTLPPPPDR